MTEPTIFLSIPVSENFNSGGTFRRERRKFYETCIGAMQRCGVRIESAALNEDWGAIKLKTVEFTKYDLEAIDRSDGLVVLTNTRLSSDIYLEIGYAAARGLPVLLIAPFGIRLTYMLAGMEELEKLTHLQFDSEDDVVELIDTTVSAWLKDLVR